MTVEIEEMFQVAPSSKDTTFVLDEKIVDLESVALHMT